MGLIISFKSKIKKNQLLTLNNITIFHLSLYIIWNIIKDWYYNYYKSLIISSNTLNIINSLIGKKPNLRSRSFLDILSNSTKLNQIQELLLGSKSFRMRNQQRKGANDRVQTFYHVSTLSTIYNEFIWTKAILYSSYVFHRPLIVCKAGWDHLLAGLLLILRDFNYTQTACYSWWRKMSFCSIICKWETPLQLR